MSSIIARRLALSIPLLFLVSVVAFGLQVVTPIDPARMALTAGGTGITLDDEDIAAKRSELGLDLPLWARYLRWSEGALQFDFGNSYMTNRAVSQLFAERIWASIGLTTTAWLISILIAIPAGLLAACHRGSIFDHVIRGIVLLFASVPIFWIALMVMWVFAAWLNWVPAIGTFTLHGIILPATVLALQPMSRLLRMVRATTLELLSAEYIAVARGKGLREAMVVLRHVMPNALAPILSVMGLDLAMLFGGAAVVEWVFAWPGIGRLSVDAAVAGDLPVLMAFIVVVGLAVVVINLLADLCSAWLDPRLRDTVR